MSRGGVQGFQQDRLGQILAVRRLTQKQLASMVGVSSSTVSKWRSGVQVPEREALENLARVVNVKPEWFTRTPAQTLSLPLFRSNASAHVAARAMLGARLEWAEEIAAALLEYVDFPEVNLPSRDYRNPEEIRDEEIEQAASECRDLWRLGRGVIENLALAAESAGVLLVREETGVAQIEGLSAWSAALGRPFILLSADKDNGYRSRFDLAHELAHLVLHRYIERTSDSARHKLMERQAHRFAGALLLPAETFVPQVCMLPTLDDLLLLKRRWGVSVAAIIMRLKALRMLDEDAAQALFKRRSARWGGKSEPGDGDREPEQPRLLRRTIDLLVEENVMPLDAVARHFGLSAQDVEALAGLPEGYLSGKLEGTVLKFVRLKADSGQSAPESFTPGSVIPFRRDTQARSA